MSILEEAGVQTRQGTHAIHTLTYYKEKYGYRIEDYPNAYKVDQLSISLPLYVGITEDEQLFITDTLKEAFKKVYP